MKKQNYFDEQILRMRRNEKSAEKSLLEQGVFIGTQYYEFSRVRIIDYRISVLLPNTFIDLPEEMAKMKYPSRPQVIKSSLDTTANFTFRWFPDESFSSERTDRAMQKFRTFLTKMNPSITVMRTGLERLETERLVWLQYRSQAVDEEIFNIAFLTPIANRMLFGSFNCRYNQYEDWWSAMQSVMRSIKDNQKERNELLIVGKI